MSLLIRRVKSRTVDIQLPSTLSLIGSTPKLQVHALKRCTEIVFGRQDELVSPNANEKFRCGQSEGVVKK
jgi:hypothetical protein